MSCQEYICRSRGKAPCILNLGVTRRDGVTFMLRLLYSRRKSSLHPLGKMLDGTQIRFGCDGKEKIPSLYQEPRSNPRRLFKPQSALHGLHGSVIEVSCCNNL
jgi:hypothetical protein